MGRRRKTPLWPMAFLKVAKSMGRALRLVRPVAKAPRGAGLWSAGMALGPAGMRRYRLLLPPGLGVGERLPLLVMLHGCTQDANGFALSTRMNRLAVQQRFAVLYPEQDRHAHLQGCWNWYETDGGLAYREAATVLAMIDQVCLLPTIDRSRAAVAGLSAGASMAALLASRYPARFCAVAMHSGVPPGAAHSTASALRAMRGHAPAPSKTPLTALPPLLAIQGTADTVVAPGNALAAAQLWAEAAGAQPGASRVLRRGQRRPMTVTDFKQRGRLAVTLCEIQGLGHAWSGGAAGQPLSDASGPDASRMIWSFALRQFGPVRTVDRTVTEHLQA
ncbi:MAG: phospholipase [Burkholderiaceae bacterium]|nr:phospholipase [Burkholderiaceae bacterium]